MSQYPATAPAQQVSPDALVQAASNMAHLAYGALQEISLLCFMTLNHLETPGEMSDAETAARILEIIENKADEIATVIDVEASSVGIAVALVRRERRKAAMVKLFAPAKEGTSC